MQNQSDIPVRTPLRPDFDYPTKLGVPMAPSCARVEKRISHLVTIRSRTDVANY